MVEAARIAYRDFPTVVNAIPESGLPYDNTMAEYAKMDSKMQGAQKAIGGSSDSAQLSQSYMWTKVARGEYDDEYLQLYHNTVILAVIAQVAIDGTKRVFAVDPTEVIQEIRNQKCMNREKDLPRFIKWAKEVPLTKNRKPRPSADIKKDKKKITNRIDPDIVCPMNWLEDCLDKVQGASTKAGAVETSMYLADKPPGKPKATQMSKIRKLVEEYDSFVRGIMGRYLSDDKMAYELLVNKTEEVLQKVSGMKIGQATLYRLIETCLGVERNTPKVSRYRDATKYTRKMLMVLYRTNRENFLKCFK